METRSDTVAAITRGLLERVKDRFDEMGEDFDELLEGRLETVLLSMTDAHLLRMAGEDERAAAEERVLEARYRTLRATLSARAANAIGETVRDTVVAGAGILLSLV